jgi:hypothetical protein
MAKKSGSSVKSGGSSSGSSSSTSTSTKSDKSDKESGSVSKPRLMPVEHWGDRPAEHDYPAAASYLSLICEPTEVRRLVTALKAAPIERHFAKDLLRASGLALLPSDNVHVASDLAKVSKGEALSPVLLMRGDFRRGVPLTIADGYHRVCASYHIDENAAIPCHLVDHRSTAPVPGFRLGPVASGGQ